MVELTDALFGYEHLLQRLFSEGGRLASAVVAAQSHENLSPVAGHQILSAISNAQLSVSGAIGHMAEGHRQLEFMAQKLWTCTGFVPVTHLIMPPWLRMRAD